MFYTPQPAFRWGTPLRLEIEATTADSVVVTHQREIVGRLTGNKGVLSIDPRGLGLGPVTLQAIAVKNGKRLSVSKPLEVEIEPERPLRPTVAPGPLKDGLVASGPNGLTVIKTTSSPTAKGLHRSDKTAGIKPGRAFRISGYVHVEEGGVHQFVAFCSGSLQIRVGGRTIFDKRDCQGEIYYAPVNLRPGLHRIEISGLPTEDDFGIKFGHKGTRLIKAPTFKH